MLILMFEIKLSGKSMVYVHRCILVALETPFVTVVGTGSCVLFLISEQLKVLCTAEWEVSFDERRQPAEPRRTVLGKTEHQFSLHWIILIRWQFTNHVEHFSYRYIMKALEIILWCTFKRLRCKIACCLLPPIFLRGKNTTSSYHCWPTWQNIICFFLLVNK